jgi:hypothetical protein
MQPWLGCPVTAIKVDRDKGVGHVYMPSDSCTDMSHTIQFFRERYPTVGHIITWQENPDRADNKLDTQYLNYNDQWIAV